MSERFPQGEYPIEQPLSDLLMQDQESSDAQVRAVPESMDQTAISEQKGPEAEDVLYQRAQVFGAKIEALAKRLKVDPTVAEMLGVAPVFILTHTQRKAGEIKYNWDHRHDPSQ